MKIKFLKTMFLLALTSSALTSCVGEDDYAIPTLKEYIFTEKKIIGGLQGKKDLADQIQKCF